MDGRPPIRWHRDREPGIWYAEVNQHRIAIAIRADYVEVGHPGRYSGYIYGEPVERTTLREFKDAVETARVLVVAALRGAR
jgi:hypothetical protein